MKNGKLIAEGKEPITRYTLYDFRKITSKVTHGAWVQKFNGQQSFEAVKYFDKDGNVVEFFGGDGNEINPN